jgi:hypothetical protein
MDMKLCHDIVQIPNYYYCYHENELKIMFAQLEVMGIPYLDALLKQGVEVPEVDKIREILLVKKKEL